MASGASSDTIFLAKTNFRKKEQVFGVKRKDRRQHMYVVGKTGVGKTAFLRNMALQDIENGEGLAIIDPHGEFVEDILNSIPSHRINDVVYFNPADTEFPVSFNILEVSDPRYKHLVASGLIGIFTKIWANVWSARMEYILANCILALIDTPGTTLLGIPRILVDKDYRQKIINNCKDPVVKSFWINEFEEWSQNYRNEAIAPVQNKVGQFLNVSLVRNIVGQAKNTIDVDEIMNSRKILLVNVSKGRIGEDNSAILGAMLITKIQLSAMERVRIPENERKDFYLYVDEFQNFATDSFVNILSEARKYRLNLIIAHQYIGQLVTETTTAVRDAVFGNVGTMVSFRVGAADAEFLELEFTPEFLQDDLIRLPNYHVYIKLMIDGITSRAFSAATLPPIQVIDVGDKHREKIIKVARERYARPVAAAEAEISKWAGNLEIQDILSQPQSQQGRKSMGSNGTTLYDATCSNCGKKTKVVFKPEPGKPVYCKSCLKKMGPKKSESQPRVQTPPGGGIKQHAAELGKLGIEFESDQASQQPSRQPVAVQRPQQVEKPEPVEVAKIEDIPFHAPKSRGKEMSGRPQKRKEINLTELKKALEESLEKKEAEEAASVEDSGEPKEEVIKEPKEEPKPEAKMAGPQKVPVSANESFGKAKEEPKPPAQEEPLPTAQEESKKDDKESKKALSPGERIRFE